MRRSDFTYNLPPERIAQEPRERGRSRMMVVTPRDGAPPGIEHESFAAFPRQLSAGDVLVLNDTRVIPARLFARPKSGMARSIELLLTRQRQDGAWEAWAKPAKRLKIGDVLTLSDVLRAEVLEKDEGTVTIRFDGDLAEIERIGVMPLPPLHRPAGAARERPRVVPDGLRRRARRHRRADRRAALHTADSG